MKTKQQDTGNGLFGGVLGIIGESLGPTRYFVSTGSAAPATGRALEPKEAAASAPGALTRLGHWIWRRQMTGVAPQLDRSQDVFDRLDRWMWRQHMREVETYLAGSQDVFELERRIRHLERGKDARFC